MQQQFSMLIERKEKWKSKKILKRLYHNWYRIIKNYLRPGSILEIGGGSGNLKEFFPDIISSDVVFLPWIDTVLDAHHLPFQNDTFDNIILFDVLHHLHNPSSFFYETLDVLKHKGRILLMEPYTSCASFFIYRFLHSEDLSLNINPLIKLYLNINQKHNFANQAIPSLIFERYRDQFLNFFPQFNIIKKERTDFIIYPLSGGFHHPSLCPLVLYPIFEYLEKLLRPLNRLLAFRLFVVLEKT